MPYSVAGLFGQVALGLIVTIPALDIGKRGRREFPELVYNG